MIYIVHKLRVRKLLRRDAIEPSQRNTAYELTNNSILHRQHRDADGQTSRRRCPITRELQTDVPDQEQTSTYIEQESKKQHRHPRTYIRDMIPLKPPVAGEKSCSHTHVPLLVHQVHNSPCFKPGAQLNDQCRVCSFEWGARLRVDMILVRVIAGILVAVSYK